MTQVMGVRSERDGLESQLVLGADMSVIGIVGTAPGFNDTLLSLNTATLIRTNDTALRAALGTTGTIPDALTAISAQLIAAAAKCVVVIVDDDDDPDVVISNIIGSESAKTGMWALLDAPDDLGVTPRLIITPGYTSQTDNQVASVAVTNMGHMALTSTAPLSPYRSRVAPAPVLRRRLPLRSWPMRSARPSRPCSPA